MSYLQAQTVSHARKVRSLYKQAVRVLQAHYEPFDSQKGSKPEVLGRIAQTSTALAKLRPIWRDKNIGLVSKIRYEFRYQAVLMRARFDEHKDEMDLRKAKKLLLDGQKELFLKIHPQPVKFPLSPGGVAFQRQFPTPDWILDTWHPFEKAQYPEYFAQREIRKKEFIERWEKQYGKPDAEVSH